MKVGDWVMAIGNPFGLGGSVTVGIISAKQRDINSGPYDDYLQTDAAINKGNSGGPLFNMDGEVIGVNTAIISPTGGSIGIGFAVPSDVADGGRRAAPPVRRDAARLARRQHPVGHRGHRRDSLGVKENTGALVSSVTPDGPAAKAGIEAGDVILKFDGKDITSVRGLPRVVAQTPIGRTVDVELLRKGKRKTCEGDCRPPGRGRGPARQRRRTRPGDKPLAGLKLAPLDRRAAPEIRHRQEGQGRVVTRGRRRRARPPRAASRPAT